MQTEAKGHASRTESCEQAVVDGQAGGTVVCSFHEEEEPVMNQVR